MIHGLQASWLLQVYVYVYMLCRLLVIEQVQPVWCVSRYCLAALNLKNSLLARVGRPI